MACESCKKKKINLDTPVDLKNNYIGKFLLFLLIMIILPFFYLFICYKLFRQIMFDESIDILSINNFLKKKPKEDIEEINPDDYQLVGVNELKAGK